MKLIITLFTIFFFYNANAQFISEDDLLHFGSGAVISSATYAVVYSSTKNSKKAFWYSLGVSTLAGLSKEIYDGYIIDGRFDGSELASTIVGGFVASYTFNIFTGKNKKKKKADLAYSNL